MRIADEMDISGEGDIGIGDAATEPLSFAGADDKDLCLRRLAQDQPGIKVPARDWGFRQAASEAPISFPPSAGSIGSTAVTAGALVGRVTGVIAQTEDRKSTRLNSSHLGISYA